MRARTHGGTVDRGNDRLGEEDERVHEARQEVCGDGPPRGRVSSHRAQCHTWKEVVKERRKRCESLRTLGRCGVGGVGAQEVGEVVAAAEVVARTRKQLCPEEIDLRNCRGGGTENRLCA